MRGTLKISLHRLPPDLPLDRQWSCVHSHDRLTPDGRPNIPYGTTGVVAGTAGTTGTVGTTGVMIGTAGVVGISTLP